MTAFPFSVRFNRFDRVAADLESIAEQAEATLYETVIRGYGDVEVEIDLAPLAEPKRSVKLSPLVRGEIDPRDAAAYVELFFHDLFLMLNLAVPGSFSGIVSSPRTNELRFDARVFEYAWVTAARNDWPYVDTLPLRDVMRWFEAQQLGTAQIATTGTARALVHLLHLARHEEDETASVTRLAQALEGLGAEVPADVDELRDAIARGTARLIHPMHDDSFDDSLDAMALDFTDAADLAASLVVSALQSRIRVA
ncbi:MAG TPA: hypothetical protein VGF48_17090 [Thermoanaerobaculia bacterium]